MGENVVGFQLRQGLVCCAQLRSKCVNVTRVCATNATNVWCFLRVLVGRVHCWFTKLYDVTYIRINVG